VEDWRSGNFPLKSESTSDTGVIAGQGLEPDNGIQIDENDDEPHVIQSFACPSASSYSPSSPPTNCATTLHAMNTKVSALEMDTDNSYVQNLLLAAENCEQVKGYDTKDLWRYTDAIRKVFSQEKRRTRWFSIHQNLAATDYIDRGLLVKEWAKGNRIAEIQRTESGTNAGGGNKTDRNPDLKHDLTLSI
jgi:exodeoxyribonuclease VIII